MGVQDKEPKSILFTIDISLVKEAAQREFRVFESSAIYQ